MIIRPSQLSSKVSLTYFFLTKSFSRKHVLPQVNACQEKKERKAPASAAAGLKKIHKLQATYTSELITIHNPNISIYLFFCNCIFSIQETKLEDHSPSQVKEKTLQPLDIGFYRLGMQAAMARLTTVCKKPILLDIRSMVTVLICSITSFFLGYEKPSARCESASSVQTKENSYVLFWNFAAVDYGLVACQASVLALTHELAQQIEEAMYIEICSFQIYFCSGPTQAFLLFLL